ncbi:MAG TPA: cysteine peptidase family C39 domain-containing protein, partial [Chloroflexota bacterium]|nr:cysteine peptidase family C39 domain-containing protein [Chloroflexota bacterium]
MNARLFRHTHAVSLPLSLPKADVPKGHLPKRCAVVANPLCPLELARRDATRQLVSAIALLALLGGQWLLPGAWLLSEAHAADGRQQKQQRQVAQTQKAAQQRAVREAAARERKQPVPGWYREARQEEQRVTKQVRLAQVQRTTTQKRTGAALGIASAKNPMAGTTNTSAPVVGPPNPATVQRMMQQQLALRAWLAKQPKRKPRAAKPGQVIPSAPLYVPNPVTSTKAIDLKNSRVPTQVEISKAGQMCGALAPTAEAEVEKLREQLDKELKAIGIAEGLKATLPRDTPPGEILFQKKERYKKAQEMTRDFANAMNVWNARNFAKAVPLMQEYAKEYPKSPWTLEALIHLADQAKYAGKPNEALMFYDQILEVSSPKPEAMSFEARQKAYERKADLFILQGRFSEARPMLVNILQNDFHWRRRTWAAHWLHQVEIMTSSRVASLALKDCGTKALAVVMDKLGKPAAARQLDAMKPTRTVGFSLLELQNLAGRHGVPMRGFRTKAQQLAKLPLPLVLHYSYDGDKVTSKASGVKISKVKTKEAEQGPGHFLVVQRIDAARGMVHLFNPQDQSRYVLNYRDLDREWSGNGLTIAKSQTMAAKAPGVTWLSAREMKDVLGACYVVGRQSGLGCNPNGQGGSGGCGGSGGSGGPEGPPNINGERPKFAGAQGSPVISINRVSQNVFITDTPMWYRPAVGPSVDVTLSYNSQDASNYNTSFGNKWSFNYGSHVVENSEGRATVFMPDGRQDNYAPNGSGGFTSETGIFNTLVKTGTLSYELRFPGGDKAIYGIPAGSGGQQPFLLELRDRWGKSLVFGYNSNIQMTTITDAQNKVTRLEWVSGAYGSRIARVTDPFERQASFSYDANGNMIECVDMEGNAFQYTYDDQANVTQLNTAQGPWTLVYENQQNLYPYVKSVTMYNPMQDQPEKFTYSGHGGYHYTDHRGNITNYSVVDVRTTDSSGYANGSAEARISTASYPGGDNYSYAYDPNSLNPSSTTDSRGLVTNSTYNAQGQPTQIQVQNPDPYAPDPTHTTTITYAANGLDVTS